MVIPRTGGAGGPQKDHQPADAPGSVFQPTIGGRRQMYGLVRDPHPDRGRAMARVPEKQRAGEG